MNMKILAAFIFVGAPLTLILTLMLANCGTPSIPEGDTSVFRYVICSDIFGTTIYEGPATFVRVQDGAVVLTEPSGVEVHIVNVECMVIKGTHEQIGNSVRDHTEAEQEREPEEDYGDAL